MIEHVFSLLGQLVGGMAWMFVILTIFAMLSFILRPHLDCDAAREELLSVCREIDQYRVLYEQDGLESDARVCQAQRHLRSAWCALDNGHYRRCLRKADRARRCIN